VKSNDENAPVAAASPVAAAATSEFVQGRVVNGVSVAAPGYIPKAGKLTVEDIEAELKVLTERMEFLNSALEELQKESDS
jgi:hypothetical protein